MEPTMPYVQRFAGECADMSTVCRVLEGSLGDRDLFCRRSVEELGRLGLDNERAVALLAHFKSSAKYGYEIRPDTSCHILELAREQGETAPLLQLAQAPFFLVKTCWLYEHAPYFYYCKGTDELDALILAFAGQYQTQYMGRRVNGDPVHGRAAPRRVMFTTFWESKIFHPLLLLQKALQLNIEGVEFSLDFHPFNFAKLLAEEISPELRAAIREMCQQNHLRLDLHSPIVGPYVPSPDPAVGRQRFYDPANCLELQFETIDLAKDIGASAIVYHLISSSSTGTIARLVERAAGSDLKVSVENYFQTEEKQTADLFVACVDKIFSSLPADLRTKNFCVTLDVGHLNIEGEDPLVAAEQIGGWCRDHDVEIRVHATDNYGNLLFSPPSYSADVHGSVSGRGINNSMVIRQLRSMGLHFVVVAEQLQFLTPEDIAAIHNAQTFPLKESYESYLAKGRKRLQATEFDAMITREVCNEPAYQFFAGIENVNQLREHLVFRKIQGKTYLSVSEAKNISRDFTKMPKTIRDELTEYIDDLLLPVQTESGAVDKTQLDLICQNISGTLFWTINREQMDRIFSDTREYRKGESICEQGRPGTEMFLVKDGEVTVYIDESPMATLGPGEIFGEISLFYSIDRSATIAAASEPAKIGVLSRSGLEELFKAGEPHVRDLVARLYRILPRRLRNLNEKYKAAVQALSVMLSEEGEGLPEFELAQMQVKHEDANFLRSLSRDETERIYREKRTFMQGERVFSEGDKADGAYFILSGHVTIVGQALSEKPVILGQLGAGEVLGEMALIDEKPRSASALALTPCEMGFIGTDAFSEFLQGESELAFRLMGYICLSLFRRILQLDKSYSELKKNLKTH